MRQALRSKPRAEETATERERDRDREGEREREREKRDKIEKRGKDRRPRELLRPRPRLLGRLPPSSKLVNPKP